VSALVPLILGVRVSDGNEWRRRQQRFLSMAVVPMSPRLPRVLRRIHRQAIDSLLSMDALFV
jgi:hypothetical protein